MTAVLAYRVSPTFFLVATASRHIKRSVDALDDLALIRSIDTSCSTSVPGLATVITKKYLGQLRGAEGHIRLDTSPTGHHQATFLKLDSMSRSRTHPVPLRGQDLACDIAWFRPTASVIRTAHQQHLFVVA